MRATPAATAASTAVMCCSTRSGASAAGIRNSVSAPSKRGAHLVARAVAGGDAHLGAGVRRARGGRGRRVDGGTPTSARRATRRRRQHRWRR